MQMQPFHFRVRRAGHSHGSPQALPMEDYGTSYLSISAFWISRGARVLRESRAARNYRECSHSVGIMELRRSKRRFLPQIGFWLWLFWLRRRRWAGTAHPSRLTLFT